MSLRAMRVVSAGMVMMGASSLVRHYFGWEGVAAFVAGLIVQALWDSAWATDDAITSVSTEPPDESAA